MSADQRPGLWIDADSCPRQVRNIVEKAARREDLALTLVANRTIPMEDFPGLTMVVVEEGDQSADRYLIEHIPAADLAITRDIPLAAELLERGALVINDRGDQFTRESIKERLSVRDFMYEVRSRGLRAEEGPPFGPKEIQAFANTFDRVLRRRLKSAES